MVLPSGLSAGGEAIAPRYDEVIENERNANVVRAAAPEAVAFVASAGGVQALIALLSALPPHLDAALIVLLHLLPDHRSHLAAILGRKTELRVKEAEDGDRLEAGCVYVAPPDVHLYVEAGGTLALRDGPAVNHLRPSGDVLLSSLAEACGGRCLAVVLTGLGRDGTAGAEAVKKAGGRVIAQDAATSEFPAMPQAAIAAGVVDQVLPLDEIAPAVVDFAAHR
jgi:two-component system, chemotaxis family, protein-glutamate methylesterase/glutaminase